MAIIRTLSHQTPKPISAVYVNRTKLISQTNKSIKIGFPTLEGYQYERVKDIVHLIAQGNYTAIYLADGKKLMISKSLHHIEKQLEKHTNFIRIHRSYMINLFFIKKYLNAGGGSIELENSTILPISNSRKEKLLVSINQFFC